MSEQYFTRPNVQPVITYIGTTPEQRQMSTDEFKAKFDEMTVNLQNYIKETLLTELDAFKQEFMTHQAEMASQSEVGHVQLGTTAGTALEGLHVNDLVSDSDGVHGLKIEEGTFTPVLKGLTTAGVNTYVIQVGFYKKIGNLVFFEANINLLTKDPAMSGAVRIGGLPYVVANTLRRTAVSVGRWSNIDIDSTLPVVTAFVNGDLTDVIIALNGDNISYKELMPGNVTDSFAITVSGCYVTN